MVQLLKKRVQWTIEVTNWKVEDKIQLVKNEQYWDKKNVN